MAAFIRSLNIADNDIFVGLSTDTKPDVSPGALAYETNTGNWFIYNLAGSWVAYGGPSGGNVASGATDSGNPVKIAGVYESSPGAVTTGQRRNIGVNPIGAVLVAFDTPGTAGSDGATTLAGAMTRSASGVGGANPLASAKHSFNGTSWDRDRNNVAATLLASASRTTTQTSADIPTYNAKAITVILDVTVVAASPSVTVTINGKDPASGKYYLLLSGAAVLTAVTNVYSVGPGIAETSNVSTSKFLPAIIQIVVTANNANAGTYSVGTNLMI